MWKIDQFHREEEKQQLRTETSGPSLWITSLAWCMDPAQHQWGGGAGGGDEAGDLGCWVVWAAAWSKKDKRHLPRRRAASLHTQCSVGTGLSFLQGHDQLCIQGERWNEASQDSGGFRFKDLP